MCLAVTMELLIYKWVARHPPACFSVPKDCFCVPKEEDLDLCQRRSKNASAGRRKNASRGLRQRRGSLAARMADCSVAPSGQAPRLRRAATRLWGLTASACTERSLLRRDARVAAVVSFQVAVVWISGVSGCARRDRRLLCASR